MNGDYTKVPLRHDERWTGARMQAGRVLLDHEWNLNLDATARTAQAAAVDTIGPAGVPVGSDAFKVEVAAAGPLDLSVAPGRFWVDGLLVLAPTSFTYSSQDQIEPGLGEATFLVYLDACLEHVQPGEDPLELLDPALAQIDSAARTRVGYRVRVHETSAASCAAALAELNAVAESDGTLTISREGAAGPSDPCAPPGDPQGRLTDGLFRVEVLDGGDASAARFVWSYEDGAATVAIANVAGDEVTLAPSPAIRFATNDLVEVSWLARRADRVDHGALYTVESVTPGPGGDMLTLDRPVTGPGANVAAPVGLALRRWNGEAEGADSEVVATLAGADLGVRFQASNGTYQAGDWWGARLREEEGTGIEPRVNARSDGIRHAFAPLALVDLNSRQVIHDCRPRFQPLTSIDFSGGACTVSVKPGDDIQAAADSLPEGGGELCFAAGLYEFAEPLTILGRQRIVLTGAGPASVLRATSTEAAVVFSGCSELEVRNLRIEGGPSGGPPGDPHLNGALTITGCDHVNVSDCVLTCPNSTGKQQTCLTVRSTILRGERGGANQIRIERNHIETGTWQTGILIINAEQALIAGNQIGQGQRRDSSDPGLQGIAVGGQLVGTIRVLDNLLEGMVQGIHLGASHRAQLGREFAREVLIARNVIHLVVPGDYKRERHAIFVGNAQSTHVLDTIATVERPLFGENRRIEAIRVFGVLGPFLVVRQSSLQGFDVGVRVSPLQPVPSSRMWLVGDTMASDAFAALQASFLVADERNVT